MTPCMSLCTLFVVLLRIFPELVRASISETWWRSHISFSALNAIHEKGETSEPQESQRRFYAGVSLTATFIAFSPYFLFARTSLQLKWLAKPVVFLCALLLWELYCWECWTEITQPCGWSWRPQRLLLRPVPPQGGKGREGGEGWLCRLLVR